MEYTLEMETELPENWSAQIELSRELSGWKVMLNGEEYIRK